MKLGRLFVAMFLLELLVLVGVHTLSQSLSAPRQRWGEGVGVGRDWR